MRPKLLMKIESGWFQEVIDLFCIAWKFFFHLQIDFDLVLVHNSLPMGQRFKINYSRWFASFAIFRFPDFFNETV